MQTEDLGRPAGTRDFPLSRSQNALDIPTLHLVEGQRVESGNDGGGGSGKSGGKKDKGNNEGKKDKKDKKDKGNADKS